VRVVGILVLSVALVPAISSCGGGSVAATAQQATLAGAVVPVSASDAAAFPSATSCTEAAALQNGAIVVAKGVPQGQINMLVGLDPGDIESGSTAVNATAFGENKDRRVWAAVPTIERRR
jgi:hypothetical protein